MRGDILTRYQAYKIGRENGWLSADDIRKLENQDPLPNNQGQIYLVPMNMAPAQQVAQGRDISHVLETRATDFPNQGDNMDICIPNSLYDPFPLKFSQNVFQHFPETWAMGGDSTADEAYRVIYQLRIDNNPATKLSDRDQEFIKMREEWAKEHYNDFRLSDVIAQMKWHVIGSRGLDYMVNLIEDATKMEVSKK